MTRRRPVAALLIAPLLIAALAGCSKKAADPAATAMPAGPVAAVAPPAGKEWTDVASFTPEGGVRMGNPDAAVKLVEYASLTCPHCRDFTAEGSGPIGDRFVKSGKVSWEYRPFVLNQFDIPAFLLVRCRGAEPAFKLTEAAYAAQNEWVGKLAALTPAQQADLQASDQAQLFRKIAGLSGLDVFFRARGLPAAQADKCLADVPAAEALARNTETATTQQNVTGTPTFFINGQLWQAPETTSPLATQLIARLTALTGG